jgi:hypothetical protein
MGAATSAKASDEKVPLCVETQYNILAVKGGVPLTELMSEEQAVAWMGNELSALRAEMGKRETTPAGSPRSLRLLIPNDPFVQEEREWVQTLFQRRWRTSSDLACIVERVERVENPALLPAFHARRRELLAGAHAGLSPEKRGSGLSVETGMSGPSGARTGRERWLFHATSHSSVRQIVLQNFNYNHSGANGPLRFGKGVYFAEYSDHSALYARRATSIKHPHKLPTVPCDEEFHCILARVIFDGSDSSSEDPGIFVVQQVTHILPTYIVSFKTRRRF